MYTETQKKYFSKIFVNIADSLDIPESKYKEAVSRYEAIGSWLDADESKLHVYKPTIYPQGSFRLGTVVKPISDNDEYDIDLVCHLEINKDDISQSQLKDMVGIRLKENETYRKLLSDEGRRCWTLDYATEFHMDILPAIPDYEKLNECILITDKKLRFWQKSNPRGYAHWFRDRMRAIFEKHKAGLAILQKANIDDVPDYKVKTPLQRSVQILKRHRDIYFSSKDYKPISVIITTLAGHAYRNEDNLSDALFNIINGMTNPNNLKNQDGIYYIQNPSNPEENFADKWNENENLPKAFLAWLNQLKVDLEKLIEQRDLLETKEFLSPIFGARTIGTAFEKIEPTNVVGEYHPEVKFTSKPNKPWAY
jgi:hypothetical protein